jgi:hypothetical protein
VTAFERLSKLGPYIWSQKYETRWGPIHAGETVTTLTHFAHPFTEQHPQRAIEKAYVTHRGDRVIELDTISRPFIDPKSQQQIIAQRRIENAPLARVLLLRRLSFFRRLWLNESVTTVQQEGTGPNATIVKQTDHTLRFAGWERHSPGKPTREPKLPEVDYTDLE